VFLDAKGQVPVAAPEMFVGRRRQIQTALQVLRTTERAGVLIHGMGQLGKSSLAARLASRLQDRMAIAVVFGRYGALGVIEALEQALKTVPAARDLLRARKSEVREDLERLEVLLTDLVSGPCAQAVDGKKPVLLIIDDLEQILEADPAGGRHRVVARHAPTLAMVLRAFDPSLTDSRLLVTSRFPFALDGLERKLHPIALPPFSDASRRKLQLRQTEAAREAALSEAELTARTALLPRVRAVARGNPGLQDLIGQKLVLSKEVPLVRAEATLAEMEAWLEGGDLPDEPKVGAFFEKLALNALFDLAGSTGRDLLQALTLFQVPVPQGVAEAVAGELGGSVVRLRDLGLLDVFEDLVDQRAPALAVNGLARSRLDPLSEARETGLAELVVNPLFTAWGGGDDRRPPAADLELTRLAIAVEDAQIIAACGNGAMAALEGNPAQVRAAFGQRALQILEQAGLEAPWLLLSRTATAADEAGEGEIADQLLGDGVEALETRRAAGGTVEPFEAGFLLFEFGKRLLRKGDLDRAVEMFEEVAALAGESEQEVNVAVVKGRIADILESRGELDAALRIRTEEQLPVYERLGKVRSVAVTKGQIADILESRGELDAALRILKEEVLPSMERLGEVRSVAVTKGQIADILQSRGELDAALRIRTEEQLPVYERLGDVRSVAVTKGRIADILQSRGELEEALRIRTEEQLPVYERLEDLGSLAHLKFSIAQIRLQKGIERQEDLQAILDDLGESFAVTRKLGRVDGIAAVGTMLGQLLAQLDQHNEARMVFGEAQAAYAKLGQQEAATQIGQLLDRLPGE
jgi:tetratricopeptide (TPR) repeat protein